MRWAREERSSRPSVFTSSRVRAPPLERRFLVADAVTAADDDFAMAGGVGGGGARLETRGKKILGFRLTGEPDLVWPSVQNVLSVRPMKWPNCGP